jgi:hypothetical protein
MLKFVLGVAVGYVFSDHIDEMLDSVKTGMARANAKAAAEIKTDAPPEEPTP